MTVGGTVAARVALAAGSGLMLAAVFPPVGWTGLAFVAWVPMVVAQFGFGGTERSSAGLGGLTVGLFFGLVALSVNPPEVVTGWLWIGVAAAVGLAGGVVATILRLPGQSRRLHRQAGGWAFVWLPAFTWAGIEYLRLITTAGHQWGMTATALVDVGPLRAFLPLAGMWPVTALTVATNYSVAGVVLIALGRAAPMRRGLAAGIATVALAWGLGLGLAARPEPQALGTLRVAAVQTGDHVPDHPQTRPLINAVQYAALTDVITELQAAGTRAAAEAGARLVVWPEASGWVDPRVPAFSAQLDRVRALATSTQTTLVWPYFLRIDPDRTRNELVLIDPNGEISAATTKDHPVWAIGERSITSGKHPVYTVAGTPVGLAAGPDGTYTDTLARLARRGAQVVAIPTHDWAAFTRSHLASLRVRAAELGIGIVKADWRYGSAVIDAGGRVIAATPTERAAQMVLVADLPLSHPSTPYAAGGDWLGLVALVVAGGATLAAVLIPPALDRTRRGRR